MRFRKAPTYFYGTGALALSLNTGATSGIDITGAGTFTTGTNRVGSGAMALLMDTAGTGTMTGTFTVLPGIALRYTAGYVTDASTDANCTLSPTNLVGYPHTLTDGAGKTVTCGWMDAPYNEVDRSTTIDVRLAGEHYVNNNGAACRFYIDLPDGAGTYSLQLAMGDGNASDSTWNQCVVYDKDETTVLATIVAAAVCGGAHFMDATGTVYTAAAWPGSNTTISIAPNANRIVLLIGYPASHSGYYSSLAYVKLVRTA